MKKEAKRGVPFLCCIFGFVLLLALVIVLLHGILIHFDRGERATTASAGEQKSLTVILDPGHGGMDSGAVAADKTEEKDLNLEVAKTLGAFLEEAGVEVIYTRTEDAMLTHPRTGSAKQGDLMGRVQVARDHPDAVFISIHMNSLPQEKYQGLQVFYSANAPESHVLAQTLQNTVKSLLLPDNKREIKKAGSNIFVLDRIETGAVMVECGFLSNREEAALLKDREYQNKLGFVLSRGILDFLLSGENS